MLKIFREPYPLQTEPATRWFQLIGLPLCIFLILAFLRPFEISGLEGNQVYLIAGEYALCTFFPLAFNLFFLMPRFEEGKWTTGREILFVLWNFFIIGMANFSLSLAKGFTGLNFMGILNYLLITLLVGFVPVTFYALFNQYRLMQHYRKEALAISNRIQEKNESPQEPQDLPQPRPILTSVRD